MKKIKIFKIKSYKNSSGILTPFSFDKNYPLRVKRIFLINGKQNKIRGNHAHKKCSQFFYPVFGKFELRIQRPEKSEKIILKDSAEIGVLIPPKYWASVKFLTKKSSLMVVCDQLYNAKDYIHNFSKYKNYLRKK